MKNFNTLVEALILTTVKPESDAVAPVKQCGCDNDNFTKVANNYLGGSEVEGGEEDVIQPDSDIGETGQEEESSGCQVEEDEGGGLIIKDGETEIRISSAAKDALVSYMNSGSGEEQSEESDEEEQGCDTFEQGEEKGEEQEEEGEEEEDNNSMFESKKENPFKDFLNKKKKKKDGKKDKKDKKD